MPAPLRRGFEVGHDIPVAPRGIPVPPLSECPVYYETAEGQDIRVVVHARGLSHPWSIAFCRAGNALVTERARRTLAVAGGVWDGATIQGVADAVLGIEPAH